jgi:hypothetical protein
MRLDVRPISREWPRWVSGALDSAGATSLLVITLELGQYDAVGTGFLGLGQPTVELGTGHTESLAWLAGRFGPLHALQLTGALIGPDGSAVRIGAEGLTVVGGDVVTQLDIDDARAARRDDLPGRPLVWQMALRTLVTELTGRAVR